MRWYLLAGLAMWVVSCGQKGPLELPTPQTAIAIEVSLQTRLGDARPS